MCNYYLNKKKFKKLYQKLQNLNKATLKRVSDDYFENVCKVFYKR